MTQAPGYKLSVDLNDIDLFRFQRQMDAGREELAAGEPEQAAQILRGALALWRGPVLADLVEAGINWPELSAAQNAQWDAMEDYFDAELACGRHLAVLSELEAMVESMALRERSSGQLMLALYRSGRQADALSVYSRVRTALVEELGLEPGRELQLLQQAILAHDPSLMPPRGAVHGEPAGLGAVVLSPVAAVDSPVGAQEPTAAHGTARPPTTRTAAEAAVTHEAAALHEAPRQDARPRELTASCEVAHGLAVIDETTAVPVARAHESADMSHPPQAAAMHNELPAPAHEGPRHGNTGGTPDAATRAFGGERRTEPRTARKSVSALLVRTQLGPELAHIDALRIDEILEDVSHRIKENIEHFDGTVSATIGSVSMALFGAHGECEDAAERAVLAALTIGDELLSGAAPTTRPPSLSGGLSFHAAVVTGEALVRYQPDGGSPLSITGALLDRGHALLSHADASEIRVCDDTRRATESTLEYNRSDNVGEWTVQGICRDPMRQDSMPTVDREFELELLQGLAERSRHRSTSHLVTVLGDAGTGKTRFLDEFERQNSDRSYLARFRVPSPAAGGPYVPPDGSRGARMSTVHAVQRELVNALCAIQPGDSPQLAMDKLTATIHRLVDDEERVGRLMACLAPFVDPEAGPFLLRDSATELAAWRQFLERTALDRPLVLIVDDLHSADDDLLDFVDGMADFSGVPLFVVASARPELLGRRPEWGGGKRHFTTITLEALSDAAVDQLVDFLLSPALSERKGSARWFHRRLYATAGDRPDERRRYIRTLLSMGAPRRLFGSQGNACLTVAEPLLSGSGRM
ncbi:AAA family ATPase [Streptomyces sp. NBC_00210]|uniref:BTAD domain-containing putative transcriptional regulator n=1 Tax=unclassified Streptomyces TaxID=2593676 RepID=UPI00324D650D